MKNQNKLEIIVYNFEYDKPCVFEDSQIKYVYYYIPTFDNADSYDPVSCFKPDVIQKILEILNRDDVTEEVSLYVFANSDAKHVSDLKFEKDEDGYYICEFNPIHNVK